MDIYAWNYSFFAHDFDLWKLHAKFKEQAADYILKRSENFEMIFWCLQFPPKNERKKSQPEVS